MSGDRYKLADIKLKVCGLKPLVCCLFFVVCSLLSYSSYAAGQYSVEFRNADIKNAVRVLAKMNNSNIVVPDSVEGKVTASFENINLKHAIESILRANNFGFFEDHGVMLVIPQKELEQIGEDLKVHSFVLNNAKAEAILGQVQSLVTARGTAVADERTNSIHVRDTNAALSSIKILVEQLDSKGQQVLIGAKLIEATTDFIRSIGIQWGVTSSGSNVQVAGLSAVGTDDAGRNLIFNAPAQLARGNPPIAGLGLIVGSFKGIMTDIQLTAAEEHGDISVLSRPSIATLENQPARIRSGERFFIKTSGDVVIGGGGAGTTTSVGNNLQEIDTGVELKVTPQISADNYIKLYIEATHSEADFSRAVDGVPVVLDSTATTTVLLRDGETTIIGGLFRIRDAKGVKGVPGLMKIPIIGNLFKNKARNRTKSELLVFITPRIIDSAVFSLPHFKEAESVYNAAARISAGVDVEQLEFEKEREKTRKAAIKKVKQDAKDQKFETKERRKQKWDK